ncbi:MAG TPA: hypothetical protein VFR58_00020, partial [Flavisolibacter sp.]|nr:hypothetical protein [Flavisolibacter sp.]
QNRQVTEVCAAVGFESLGSFSLLFKKQIGFSPAGFRTRAKEKKQMQQEQPRAFVPHCFLNTYGPGRQDDAI